MLKRLHDVYTDARFALRLLRRSPGFSSTLLGVLIVGIGATTAMFSLVVSLLLRPLPYPHSEELTMIWFTQPQVSLSPASIPDFTDWRAQATTFQSMSAVEYESFSLSSPGTEPSFLPGANVSGDFFSMLSIAPLRGRLLNVEDDRVGGPGVAVISASLWRERFGSTPSIIGQTIALNQEQYTIVGIAPEGFSFSGPNSRHCDVWTPLAVTRKTYAKQLATGRGDHFLHVMGRRKAGVTLDQAQAQLSGIAKTIETQYPDSNKNDGVKLLDLHDQIVGSFRQDVWILFAAVGLVFLVVCANVANLLLARAASRRGEMAARAALGATRRRLMAQIVTETAVVFVLGGLGGALLARWLVDLFTNGLVSRSGLTIDVHVDGTALLFAIGTSLFCGLLFGLVPAAEASRVEPHAVLKASGAHAPIGRPQRLVRGGLIIAQVALAFALLAGSGLALRAFAKVASTPMGFDATNVTSASIWLPAVKYGSDSKDKVAESDARVAEFAEQVLAHVSEQPAMTSVALSTSPPMSDSNWSGSFAIEGRPKWAPGTRQVLERTIITPNYFKTLGIPIMRGRDFNASDVKNGHLVLIINQTAADKYFPNEDPIGRRIDWGVNDDEDNPEWAEIVGVVGNVRKHGLTYPIQAESFAPFAQRPYRWFSVVARTERPDALLHDLPAIVASIDSAQAVANRRKIGESMALSIAPQRFVTTLLAAFAAAALLLATLGIFGLVSYTTSQRTRELGIRLALGSSPQGVMRVVMREGLRLLGVGLVLGLVGALFVGRALASRVSGAPSFDLIAFASIFALLLVAGTLASLFPALRAVRIPPAVALRYE